MAKILLIEDDIDQATLIADLLAFEQHLVEWKECAEEALAVVASEQYDLIILDWQLPDLSGVELCAKLRESSVDIPVLMLTGCSDVRDKQLCLDAGANDYLVKPVPLQVLTAHVRALLIRQKSEAEQSAGW